jgi:hypothetical protein
MSNAPANSAQRTQAISYLSSLQAALRKSPIKTRYEPVRLGRPGLIVVHPEDPRITEHVFAGLRESATNGQEWWFSWASGDLIGRADKLNFVVMRVTEALL